MLDNFSNFAETSLKVYEEAKLLFLIHEEIYKI